MRISDWSSDVCSSDLQLPTTAPGTLSARPPGPLVARLPRRRRQVPIRLQHDHPLCLRSSISARIPERRFPRSPYPSSTRPVARPLRPSHPQTTDPKRVVTATSVSLRVDPGGRRIIKKKQLPLHTNDHSTTPPHNTSTQQ